MWLTWAWGSAVSKGPVFNCSSEGCENSKSFYYFFFFTVNTFLCCLILGPVLSLLHSWGMGGWNHLCFSINTAVYLWRDLIGGFFLVLLLHDKYSLYFYYYTECKHFQTYWGRSCNSPCSSVNSVCWPAIKLGVLFSSCYFKINWKTNHSNHFEIKEKNSHIQTKLIIQTKCLYSTWLEKIYPK